MGGASLELPLPVPEVGMGENVRPLAEMDAISDEA